MNNDELELEKGWTTFIVPKEEIESPAKKDSYSKSSKLEDDGGNDSEYEPYPTSFIPRKPRTEPEPVRPEIEEAKRLIHILSKNHKIVWPFTEPVDPKTLNVPDYFTIIKNPMDLSTIHKNLLSGIYSGKIAKFVSDVRLVFTNAVMYNSPSNMVFANAIQCSNIFEKKLEKCKYINPPPPLGIGRSIRWNQPIGWRRAPGEELIVWNARKEKKSKKLARSRKLR